MNVHALQASQLSLLSLSLSVIPGCRLAQTPPDHPFVADGVRTEDVTFWSPSLNRMMTYRVFLPAAPGPRPLPVVYLLHGSGDTYLQWSNRTEVSRQALAGLILVMPPGENSYYMNAAGSPRKRYEDFITRDLISDVESRFPARKDRAGRAFVGISMGGFAAVEYALARPDLFAFAGALSPAIDITERRFSWARIGQWWRFRQIFGPSGGDFRRAHNPFVLARSADPAAIPYLYLTVGKHESFYAPNCRFVEILRKRGFAFEFHQEPGGHDWTQWNAQVPGCFQSLLAHLAGG